MKKLEIGMLVERKILDPYWAVPDIPGHGIVISAQKTLTDKTVVKVLWSTNKILELSLDTLQPYGTRYVGY